MAASQHQPSPQLISSNGLLFPIAISIFMDFHWIWCIGMHIRSVFEWYSGYRFLEGTNDRDLEVSPLFIIDIIALLFWYYIIPAVMDKKVPFLSFEIYNGINGQWQITWHWLGWLWMANTIWRCDAFPLRNGITKKLHLKSDRTVSLFVSQCHMFLR